MEETTMREETETSKKFISFIKNHKFMSIVTASLILTGVLSLVFWDCTVVILKFCDRRPESISVIVTVVIALVTGPFTIYQSIILKRKGKIQVYSLYYSIAKTLKSNTKNIIDTVEKYSEKDKHYLVSMADEWRINKETVKRIYDLEKLLYEHGKRGDDGYTKETIKAISAMRELVHVINIAYTCLKEENNVIVQDQSSFNKLKKKFEYLEGVIENYQSESLKKYISL